MSASSSSRITSAPLLSRTYSSTSTTDEAASFPKSLEDFTIKTKPFPNTSNDTFFVEANGKNFVVKHHKNADPEQGDLFVKNEYHAWQAFKALGLNVPDARLYEGSFNGKSGLFFVTEYIEKPKELCDLLSGDPEADAPVLKQLGNDFIKICLLGAWDVVGLCWNNILSDENGILFYIDYGLSFGYMHDGKTKMSNTFLNQNKLPTDPANRYSTVFDINDGTDWFSEKVFELAYLRDHYDRLGAACIYEHLSKDEIQQQINDLDLKELIDLAEKGLFPSETMKILETRTNWLKSLNLVKFEDLWNKFKEERITATESSPGKIPTSSTRGMELIAVKTLGAFPSIKEEEDPENRPEFVSAIYTEVENEGLWLKIDEEKGCYTMPRWKASDRSKSYVWEMIIGLSRRTNTRAHLSEKFISSDVGNTRYYSMMRKGGAPSTPSMKYFTFEEAMEVLNPDEKQALNAYRGLPSSVQNISPTLTEVPSKKKQRT